VGDKTRIEWTDATWNPVTGCTRVSEGCRHCYIERTPPFRMAGRKFSTGEVGGTTGVLLHPERLAQPLHWRKPRRVFVNSLADLFHDDVPDAFLARMFAVMAATPQPTYQILTKRPARMRSFLVDQCRCGAGHPAGVHLLSAMSWAATPHNPDYVPGLTTDAVRDGSAGYSFGRPLPNVWLGVSTEDQRTADQRIPILLDPMLPAAVRWISAEPLLGPIDLDGPLVNGHRPRLTYWLTGRPHWGAEERQPSGLVLQPLEIGPKLDWVVVGGESGPGARPMHPDWARSLRDQCAAAGVPMLFKQWGEWAPADWAVRVCDPAVGWQGADEELAAAKRDAEARGATHAYASWAHEYGWDLYEPHHKPWSLERADALDGPHAPMRRWGKAKAGRELDGVVHDEYPAGAR
jgi:protein gp37